MEATRLVGVGASAGGVEALLELVDGLDPDLPAAVLVVLHQAPNGPSVLPGILSRRCALDVVAARDGDPLRPGRVLVAPPDRHLQVEDGRVRLSRGPKESGHRPSVDVLFRSLALEAGHRATGVVLSGMLDDGAAGLSAIVDHGGKAIVQDPDDALHPGMPRAALDRVPHALVTRPVKIGAALAEIAAVGPDRAGQRPPSALLAYEVAASRPEGPDPENGDPPGTAAGLQCPDCSGPLFEVEDGGLPRFRCRVGHGWGHESLQVAQDEEVERALYAALRALEDKAALSRRVAESALAVGGAGVAARARRSARAALDSAGVLRRLLADGTLLGDEVPKPDDDGAEAAR